MGGRCSSMAKATPDLMSIQGGDAENRHIQLVGQRGMQLIAATHVPTTRVTVATDRTDRQRLTVQIECCGHTSSLTQLSQPAQAHVRTLQNELERVRSHTPVQLRNRSTFGWTEKSLEIKGLDSQADSPAMQDRPEVQPRD